MTNKDDLRQRLEKALDEIPAIDTHVHIIPGKPLAQDLAQILYYHNYVSELVAAGAPESLEHNQSIDGRKRVETFIREMRRSEGSSHAWMLRELLKTVYGFDGRLDERNWKALYEKVDAARTQPGRLNEVCRKAGVEKVLIHLPAQPMGEIGCDASVFVGLSDLCVPSMPDAAKIAAFERQTGESADSADKMLAAAVSYLKRGAALGHRGLRIGISPYTRIRRPGMPFVRAAFSRAATGGNLSDEDRAMLETFALDAALTGAAETGMTVQVFVEGSFLGGLRLPSAEQCVAETIWSLAEAHPSVAFEIYSISATMTHNLCIMAKYVKNIYLSGVWWLCQFPSVMDSTYALRLESLPGVKWSAFFSDAYEIEWLVGKAALTRRVLARSLASHVANGYMSEEEAAAAARQVLYETPKRLYKIA